MYDSFLPLHYLFTVFNDLIMMVSKSYHLFIMPKRSRSRYLPKDRIIKGLQNTNSPKTDV
ncbi:MAG: hypothetical protein ACLFV6_03005 [Spirulinaceae cyanobacterium]